MSSKKKERQIKYLAEKILQGEFGYPGERFMTTRELEEYCKVSLVTAQGIMTELRKNELITLYGKNFYLSYGRLKNNSPLQKRREKKRLLGVHITELNNPYFSSLAREVEIQTRERGYETVIVSSGYNFEEEYKALKLFQRLGADGVISTPSKVQEVEKLYSRYTLPFVFLSSAVDGVDADRVLINNFAGGKSVAEHFIKNGYRSFVYVTLKKLRGKTDARLDGFIEGLKKHGFTLPENKVIYVDGGNNNFFSNYVGQLLYNEKLPTGVFCYHDLLASELMRVCRQYGINVPRDVGVSGYDNLKLIHDMFPTLTSVDYRINKLVSIAVDLLIKRIEGETGESKELFVEPILTIRGSSSRMDNTGVADLKQ